MKGRSAERPFWLLTNPWCLPGVFDSQGHIEAIRIEIVRQEVNVSRLLGIQSASLRGFDASLGTSISQAAVQPPSTGTVCPVT